MPNKNTMPRSLINFPSVMPSFCENIEELLPTTIWPSTNLFQGLSLSEDDKNVYVEAALHGVDPKEIEVTYSKGVLTIKGEKKEEEKSRSYQRKATKSFFYRVMPGDADLEAEPQAMYKNGIMKVTFVQSAELKPKKIPVKTE